VNDFEIVGGATTVIDALPELFPPASEETTTELLSTPAAMPVTFTENVHPALAASVAPDSEIEPEPVVAVIVPPPQLPDKPFGVATTKPTGNESTNPTPVSESVAFGLLIVNDSEVDPPTGTEAPPNDFEIVGASTTARFALLVVPFPPSFDVTTLVVFV
jgi:hypothetical protein